MVDSSPFPGLKPIDIQTLPKHSDEQTILQAMGAEAANVHLGTKRQVANILKDLSKRKANWLRDSATHMARNVEKDWNRYRKS